MPVSVTRSERQPVGNPLGQSDLQAVVVGAAVVRNTVDKPQVGKPGGVRPGFQLTQPDVLKIERGRVACKVELRCCQGRVQTVPCTQRGLIDVKNTSKS